MHASSKIWEPLRRWESPDQGCQLVRPKTYVGLHLIVQAAERGERQHKILKPRDLDIPPHRTKLFSVPSYHPELQRSRGGISINARPEWATAECGQPEMAVPLLVEAGGAMEG
jgi:hypothetical protein